MLIRSGPFDQRETSPVSTENGVVFLPASLGVSVDDSVRIAAGDAKGLEQVAG